MAEPSGKKMRVPDEELFRQVHPNYVDGDVISSQSFQPMPKDDGYLSVSASSIVTAAESFNRFIEAGGASAGVMVVTIKECTGQELDCYYDPIETDNAHAVIDMSSLTRSQQKRKGKVLHHMAWVRGWQHQPD